MSGQQDKPDGPVKAAGLVGYGGLAAVAAFLIGLVLTGIAWSGLLTRHHNWFWPVSHAVDRRLLVIGLAILAAGAAGLTFLLLLPPRLRGVPETKGNHDEH